MHTDGQGCAAGNKLCVKKKCGKMQPMGVRVMGRFAEVSGLGLWCGTVWHGKFMRVEKSIEKGGETETGQ